MKLNAWNMSSGEVEIHAVGCQHRPGSGKARHARQEQVEFGKTEWTSCHAFAHDYWDNGILEEHEAEYGVGTFDVFQCMDFKPCVTLPQYDPTEETEMAKATEEKTTKAPAAAKAEKTEKTLPGKAPNEVPAPRAAKSKALPGGKCRCGCGREVGRASTFAQGHDAKWITALLARITSGDLTKDAALAEAKTVSDALEGKLSKALENAAKGAETKAATAKAKADKAAKAAEVKAAAQAAAAQAKAEKSEASDLTTEDGDDEDESDDEDDLDLDDESDDSDEDDDF